MKTVRRVVFWCHLAAGVTAGSIVLIMSVTGVLLAYERQILSWADTRSYRAAPQSADTPRLAPSALLDAVRNAQPDVTATAVTTWSDPEAPAAVAAGARVIYVNPYSGQVLGEGAARTRVFFRRVTDWHRWLGVSGDGRAMARTITGASNLAFLFLVVSGTYLWLPRTWAWTWRQVRTVLWFRGKLAPKARDFNWHNVIGVWSAAPLLVVVLSGVVISYPWASNLVYRAYGETPPQRAASPGGAGSDRPRDPRGGAGAARLSPAAPFDRLDAAWTRALQLTLRSGSGPARPNSVSMRVPASAGGPVVFTIDEGNGGQPQKRATLTLDGRTGEVIAWEPFSRLSPGRRMRSYLRFAHTGEAAGVLGQTIAALASAGAALLVWTGISLALRRMWAWRAGRAAVGADRAA